MHISPTGDKCLETFLVVTLGINKGVGSYCIYWAEARDVVKHPTMPRTPTAKTYSAKTGKP